MHFFIREVNDMDKNPIVQSLLDLLHERLGQQDTGDIDRDILIRLLNCLHENLPDLGIVLINEAVTDFGAGKIKLIELYDIISQRTALPLLKHKNRKWSVHRKPPYHKNEITEEEHCRMVVEDLDILNASRWRAAYRYFNDCRKGREVLDEDAFKKIWRWNQEIMNNSNDYAKKRKALVAVFHDYGKLTMGPDHPQDAREVLPSLLKRLELSEKQQKEILAEIEQHDCLFAMASGENVPKNIKTYFLNKMNFDKALLDLVVLQMVDSTNVRGLATEFLNEIVSYAENFDDFTEDYTYHDRLLRIMLFEKGYFENVIRKGVAAFDEPPIQQVQDAKEALDAKQRNKDGFKYFQEVLENVRFRYAFGVFLELREKVKLLIDRLFEWSERARARKIPIKQLTAIVFDPKIDAKLYAEGKIIPEFKED
jgi:hypothetical protein